MLARVNMKHDDCWCSNWKYFDGCLQLNNTYVYVYVITNVKSEQTAVVAACVLIKIPSLCSIFQTHITQIKKGRCAFGRRQKKNNNLVLVFYASIFHFHALLFLSELYIISFKYQAE